MKISDRRLRISDSLKISDFPYSLGVLQHPQQYAYEPMPISLLVWVRSFIEPDVLKTMYRSTIPLRFI